MSKMEVYNKLVRDKIPEVIESKGLVPTTHIADDKEYRQSLKAKLLEEVDEFLKDENREEIADIIEVLTAIQLYKNFDPAEVETIRQKKAQERGGFKGRIILETVKTLNE